MACLPNTSPSEITFPVTYRYSFSSDFNYLVCTDTVAHDSAVLYSTEVTDNFISYRCCLEEGIVLSVHAGDQRMVVDRLDAYTVQPFMHILTEYVSLEGQFAAGQVIYDLDNEHYAVRIGGYGVVDLLDTDPSHFSYHAMPYSGAAKIRIAGTEGLTDIQVEGVMLQKTTLHRLGATFENDLFNVNVPEEESASLGVSVLAMGLVYTIPGA